MGGVKATRQTARAWALRLATQHWPTARCRVRLDSRQTRRGNVSPGEVVESRQDLKKHSMLNSRSFNVIYS